MLVHGIIKYLSLVYEHKSFVLRFYLKFWYLKTEKKKSFRDWEVNGR